MACSIQSISRLVCSGMFSSVYFQACFSNLFNSLLCSVNWTRWHAYVSHATRLFGFGNCFVKSDVNVFSMYGYRILGHHCSAEVALVLKMDLACQHEVKCTN